MILHVRSHETGKRSRVRVWTDDMANYGQFEVRPWEEVSQFLKLGRHLGIVSGVVVHHCQTNEECAEGSDWPCRSHEELPEEL